MPLGIVRYYLLGSRDPDSLPGGDADSSVQGGTVPQRRFLQTPARCRDASDGGSDNAGLNLLDFYFAAGQDGAVRIGDRAGG